MKTIEVSDLRKPWNWTIFGLRFFVAYCLLLNVPFWMAARFLDTVPRGLFNLEYIAIGILSLFVPFWLSFALLEFALITDLVRSSSSFYFFTQHDVLSSIRYIVDLPPSRLAIYATLLLVPTCFIAGLAQKVARRRAANRSVVVCVGLLIASLLFVADVAHGTNSMVRIRDTKGGRYKLACAPTVTFAKVTYDLLRTVKEPEKYESVDSAARHFVFLPNTIGTISLQNANAASVHPPNLVLILFESLGKFRNLQLQQLLNAAFGRASLTSKYEVEFGEAKFEGPTVYGEFRELCGLSGRIGRHPSTVLEGCLPSRLKKAGYDTTALHGFRGDMFERVEWYPEMGFSHMIFRDDLEASTGLHDCQGAFVGVCDADMAQVILKLSQSTTTRPQFFYWVTLDSHLPIMAQGESSCGADISNGDVCAWLKIVRRTLDNIANISLDPGLPVTEFIIVGDHAPPFIVPSSRNYFDPEYVPFVHLIPRGATATADRKVASAKSKRDLSVRAEGKRAFEKSGEDSSDLRRH